MALRYPGGFISPNAPTVNANTAKGVWTLEEAMQYIKAGQWPVPTGNGDPYFQYNTMLLPGQGTNNANNKTFLDSSSNNFNVYQNGNTTQGTFTPFSQADGYWGNYFDGSGDYLSIANNAAFDFGSGDMTIECWFYLTADAALNNNSTRDATLFAAAAASGAQPTNYSLGLLASNTTTGTGLTFHRSLSGADTDVNYTVTVSKNQWHHIAAVRSGSSLSLYYDGVRVALNSSYSGNIDTGGWSLKVGALAYAGYVNEFPGYISNLRVLKGTAQYSGATYTVPTSPLTAVANTSFLTCQSNRFKDNSTNAFAITANGAPLVTPFEPFGAPTTAYSASTVGGSGYFDGSSDYLTATANNAFNFGSGDFTVEGWIYPVAAGNMGIWANGPASAGSFGIAINSSGKLQMDYYGGTSLAGATNVPVNAWSYFAFVRTGSTLNIYLNGVRDATTTTSSNNSTNDFALGLGWTNITTGGINGYVSGFRVSDAYARYTGTTMTVPTAPLTNDGNTSVLLNFTNAGIIDNAEKNDLETVGGAQISTSQYKWGASSMYFDGTGDWLIVDGGSPNYIFGTGDFTIEMWINPSTVSPSYQGIWDSRTADPSVTPHITLASGAPVWWVSGAARITGSALSASTWYHLAVSRTGGSTKMFVNGNQVGSTYADTNNYTSRSLPTIGVNFDGLYPFTGYLQDLRITKGYARYPYNFTAPTAAFPLFYQAAATPSSDPYFEYTTLLLPGNGTNGAQNNTFLDSSANNFAIARNPTSGPNAPTQGTFTPFSQTGWGNFFDGTGDMLSVANNTALNLSGADFTVEAFVYRTGDSGIYGEWIIGKRSQSSGDGYAVSWNLVVGSSNKFVFGNGNATYDVISSTTAVLNTWYHVAVVRTGTTASMYVNGVLEATVSGHTITEVNTPVTIGNYPVDNPTFTGYISNTRVVKGTAVYSGSSFTVPTSPLTAVANTSLLTCQSNRFVDNSTNNFTITPSADVSVQAFSPFNPTASYSTSTVGGSGYFDGSGDYLSATNSSSYDFGSGDFTIEGFAYPTTASQLAFCARGETTGFSGFILSTTNFLATTNGSSWDVSITFTTALTANAWNHVALVRNGNVYTAYLNGVANGTTTVSGTIVAGTAALVIGRRSGQTDYSGYLSNFRIVKGTAVYTSAFTPPTAPLTAISGTSLLLSCTNGGITDATAKNDLETVGGASISTTVSKFGGSSMYFDGSGDYLISNKASSSLVAYGTGDFTVEFWLYLNTTSGTQLIYDQRKSSASDLAPMLMYYTNAVCYYTNANIQITGSALTVGTWNHIALCRYSGSTRLYINGVQSGSTYSDSNNYVGFADRPVIGAEGVTVGNNPLNGYVQDLRVTKGIARYTTNFTPPTTAFLTL